VPEEQAGRVTVPIEKQSRQNDGVNGKDKFGVQLKPGSYGGDRPIELAT
jgi:hypothetical protein